MDDRLAQHPSGILIYHPAGSRPMEMGRWLGIEFTTELIEAFLAVYLLSMTRLATFGGRCAFVTLAGLLAAIATNVSYWDWYGFPGVYILSYIFIQVMGFFCVGLVAGFLMKPRAA
jgi:hypothetical protein